MKAKFLILVLTVLFLAWPLAGQTAFRWPWQRTDKQASTVSEPVVDKQALKTGNDKVRGWEKLVEAKPLRAGQSFVAEFTQAELQAIVRDAISQLNSSSVSADSFKVEVGEGKVTLQAVVLKPVRFNMQIVVGAKLADGQLLPEVKSARVGIFSVGGHVVERLASEVFGKNWRSELNSSVFVWEEITMTAGKVRVAGHTVKPKGR